MLTRSKYRYVVSAYNRLQFVFHDTLSNLLNFISKKFSLVYNTMFFEISQQRFYQNISFFLIFTLKTVYLNTIDNGGCSSVGRAPDCGSGCRGFDPHHSPQTLQPLILSLSKDVWHSQFFKGLT